MGKCCIFLDVPCETVRYAKSLGVNKRIGILCGLVCVEVIFGIDMSRFLIRYVCNGKQRPVTHAFDFWSTWGYPRTGSPSLLTIAKVVKNVHLLGIAFMMRYLTLLFTHSSASLKNLQFIFYARYYSFI